MTINMSKKDLVWNRAKPMKEANMAEYRQSSYNAETRYTDAGALQGMQIQILVQNEGIRHA